jgi:hypothetical protein
MTWSLIARDDPVGTTDRATIEAKIAEALAREVAVGP